MDVIFLLVNTPIIFFWLVKETNGIIAKGNPKLSNTWLITSVREGSRPIATTIMEGTMVTRRRIQTGISRCRNPFIITCPAIVPTEAEDNPENKREIPKTAEEALPIKGSSVL